MTRCANASGAGMTASHLLMELLAIPLSQQAGKWLVIPQSAGFTITSDLVRVNQRLMSPYFGDLAEWLCKAVCVPSRMASCSISNVSEVRS